MNSKERRETIVENLRDNKEPIKGAELAKKFCVTRQVIVKDIAILRAEGCNIIATPEGYMFDNNIGENIRKVIAVSHTKQDIEDELYTIIKYGGKVEDVIIEHSLYGEIRAMLKITNIAELEHFIENLNKNKAEPLSKLTQGIHLHTIEAKDKETIDKIIKTLQDKGYLISDDN